MLIRLYTTKELWKIEAHFSAMQQNNQANFIEEEQKGEESKDTSNVLIC